MPHSKVWVSIPENQQEVLRRYKDKSLPTIMQVAKDMGTQYHNVCKVLQMCLPEAERKAMKAVRLSIGKLGSKNPMFGKNLEEHHNWKGDCDDGYGYLTRVWVDGKRHFVHHIVMMELLGITELPKGMDVHHIDSDTKHNHPDNLALVTKKGHHTIHFLQVKDSLSVALKRSTIAEVLRSMTSQ